jgi:probable HAF family extracellular repeat protein
MHNKSRFAFCALLTSLVATLASAQVYTITDLGPLSPTAINMWGQVVGNINGQAFIWTQFAGQHGLGTLTGGTFSNAARINDLGVVTGTADGPATIAGHGIKQVCSDLTQPFVWTRQNGMQGLGGAVLDTDFEPCDVPFYGTWINIRGQVVGYDGIYSGDWQFGFVWTNSNGMTQLGGSFPPTSANAIRDNGQIVGQNSTSLFDLICCGLGLNHATSWQSGVTTDLGTLGVADVAYYASSANGVNDLGQVVGWSNTTPVPGSGDCYYGSPAHAVLWTSSGEISDLGTLPGDTFSTASNINFFGQVIGSSGNTATCDYGVSPFEVIGRPFIWTRRSGMQDLNTLISANSGWVLNSATGINIWGQIVGLGTLNGQSHGFLLTPKFRRASRRRNP